jgi:HK97 family phage prohead protease
MEQLPTGGELRLALSPLQNTCVRDATGTGDGSWTMEGYAAVFDQETTLWEIPGWFRLREEIAPGAFTNVLARVAAGDELVHLNYVHMMAASVAATDVDGIGRLELGEDPHGLRFFARVDPDDPDVQRMAVKMRRRIVKQASFAFTIAKEELVESTELDDGTRDQKWRILEIGHLYDVCACPQGAYAGTESNLRSLAAASLGRIDLDSMGQPRRAPEAGGSTVAPQVGGVDLDLRKLKANVRRRRQNAITPRRNK